MACLFIFGWGCRWDLLHCTSRFSVAGNGRLSCLKEGRLAQVSEPWIPSFGDIYVSFVIPARPISTGSRILNGSVDQSLPHQPLSHPPLTFVPCPSLAPLIRWNQLSPHNGRPMTAHTKNAIRDLPRWPDPPYPLIPKIPGIAQCASYDSATTMSQMSHYSATKHFATATSSVPSQL